MAELFTNNAESTLASGISDTDTSASVGSGHGARWPTLGVADWCYSTITDGTNVEVVLVTARSTDTLTIVRGQQGTTAQTWSAGATIRHALTRDSLLGWSSLVVPAIGGVVSGDYLYDGRYYSLNSDPFSGVTAYSLLCIGMWCQGAEDYDTRYLCGTYNGTGGVGIRSTSGFNPISTGLIAVTNTATRDHSDTTRRSVGKLRPYLLTGSCSGSTATHRLWDGQTPMLEGTTTGDTFTAGGNLCFGTSAEGAVSGGDGLQEGYWVGGGYVTRALDYAEAGWLMAEIMRTRTIPQLTGGNWTAAWMVGSSAPTSTLSAMWGTGTLTLEGTPGGTPGYKRIPAIEG